MSTQVPSNPQTPPRGFLNTCMTDNLLQYSAPSLHSRAARRATSPSINTDKSLKTVQPPSESLNQRPAILGLYQNAGVTKRNKHGRKAVMSSRARRRHEKGLMRAEGVVDRTAVKVAKSKKAESNIAGRKKTWDEINASVGAGGDGGKGMLVGNMFGALGDEDDDEEDVEDVDDEMWEAGEAAPAQGVAAKEAAVPPSAPPPQDDDDIL